MHECIVFRNYSCKRLGACNILRLAINHPAMHVQNSNGEVLDQVGSQAAVHDTQDSGKVLHPVG